MSSTAVKTSSSIQVPPDAMPAEQPSESKATLRETRPRNNGEDDAPENRKQAGVKKAVLLRKYMTKRALMVAYSALFLLMFANRFSVYTANTLNAYATSAFSEHSLLSTAGVVHDITQLCAYPIIAKLEDVTGRAEGFALSVAFLTLSSILYAACPNIETYLIAGIFDSIGDTGLLLTEQVFIAETTNLINRGLFAAIPESISGIIALFAGSLAAEGILKTSTWRWGYGMWAIIVPVVALPLLITMFILELRAMREKESPEPSKKDHRGLGNKVVQFLWVELDFGGVVLLIAGLALILVPLSLTGSTNAEQWSSASFISMLVVGAVALVAFGFWDGRFAKMPIVPFNLIKNRTVVAASLLGMLDFLSYSVFGIFFPSFLQVAANYSPAQASLVNNSLIVAYQGTRIITGILLRYTKRTQIWIILGVALCILGQGLMIRFTDVPGGDVANKASFVVSKVLVGVGRGFYHTASLVSVQALVSEQELSVATAIFLALMSVGGAIGTSIGGAVWRNTLLKNLHSLLPEKDKADSESIFGSIVVAQGYGMGTPTRDAINHAYRASMRILSIIATCLLVPMVVLLFAIKPLKLDAIGQRKDEDTGTRVARERDGEENNATKTTTVEKDKGEFV